MFNLPVLHASFASHPAASNPGWRGGAPFRGGGGRAPADPSPPSATTAGVTACGGWGGAHGALRLRAALE